MKIPLEESEQKALIQWLKLNKITHHANANENIIGGVFRQILIYLLGKIKGTSVANKAIVNVSKKLKSMGSTKGLSDLTVILPNKVLYIELKRQKGVSSKVSSEQIKFIDKVNKSNVCEGRVCYGFVEAKAFVEEYLI